MAKEYIERKLALSHPFANGKYDREHADEHFILGHESYKEWLEQLPTADVQPVKHGHYVGEYDGYADGNPVIDMWYCSECGCYFEDWDEKPTYNYCPICGAMMDKEG